jgi:hypothetical protein
VSVMCAPSDEAAPSRGARVWCDCCTLTAAGLHSRPAAPGLSKRDGRRTGAYNLRGRGGSGSLPRASQPRRPRIARFMSSPDPIELEPVTGPFTPQADRRQRVPEPPPVRLVAVDDVRLQAESRLEKELDSFYVGVLKFEREEAAEGTNVLRYKAENFRLRIVLVDHPVDRGDDLRMLGVVVPGLLAVEHALIEREIDYARQKGLIPGQESLLLRDPAGNWLEITETRLLA